MPRVIIPWRGGCGHRERALGFVCGKYADMSWPVTVAEGGEPWIKADALMPAVEDATASIIVVADADVWTDGLAEAVRAVELGAAWAKPHNLVYRLTEASTEALYRGEPWSDLDQRPYQGVAGGGFIVARRETLLAVPMDPRFIGWGQEDIAYAFALNALAGPVWKGSADLIHLWHPPQKRLSRTWGSIESKRLLRRYGAGKGNPDLMRELVKEIHASRRPVDPDMLHRSPDPLRG